MQKNTIPLPRDDQEVLPGYSEDLTQPPHVLPQLIEMIADHRQPPPAQKESRLQHLATCIQCQTFLGIYLLELIAEEKKHNKSVEVAQQWLDQVKQLMHETLQADIPAYTETLVELGEKKASERFPELAQHIHTCQDCYSTVQDVRSWLHRLAEEGLL